MTRARTALPFALLVLAGCREIPEVAYETEHFEIAPDFDHPICAGTLAHFEDHLDFVESALARSVPFGERIRFYWITEDLDSWCSDGSLGCYYPGTRVIVGTGESASHEIVHAVLNAEATTNYFLEEALAELFSGVGAYHRDELDQRPSPSELLWLSPTDYRFGELDYEVAAHFMAYVYREYGSGSTRGIAEVVVSGAGPPDLEQVFERFTGFDFDYVEADYEARASVFYPGLREDDVALVSDRRFHDVSLRCDEDTTFGPLADASPGMYRTLRVVLEDPQVVEVELRAPADVRVTVVDVRRERSSGRVVDFFHPKLSGRREHPIVHGGERVSMSLRAGTHLLVIERAGYDYTDAFLQIDPIEFPRASQ
ncbi:MAG TPA: hypothetical protein VM869_04420 [Enhygromyxa sp.]|nr:hypothetical protein [Enhygromyxa sp.]